MKRWYSIDETVIHEIIHASAMARYKERKNLCFSLWLTGWLLFIQPVISFFALSKIDYLVLSLFWILAGASFVLWYAVRRKYPFLYFKVQEAAFWWGLFVEAETRAEIDHLIQESGMQ